MYVYVVVLFVNFDRLHSAENLPDEKEFVVVTEEEEQEQAEGTFSIQNYVEN